MQQNAPPGFREKFRGDSYSSSPTGRSDAGRVKIAVGSRHIEEITMGSSDLLAGVTTRLASTARLDEIVDTVLNEIVGLGFGAVWVARMGEQPGELVSLKSVVDGVDITNHVPRVTVPHSYQPIA